MVKHKQPSTRLVVPCHLGNAFHWEGLHGRAEASTLTAGNKNRLDGRVWQDAADVGFEVVSPKTGRRVLFLLHSVGDNDGDVTHWCYVSHDFHTELTITVFND